MSDDPPDGARRDGREARLAQALKANLRRRKVGRALPGAPPEPRRNASDDQ